MNALTVHQLRSEYMDACIGECNAICNAIEAGVTIDVATDDARLEDLRQQAQLVGDYANQRFEAFVQACNDMRAEPPGPTGGTLVELGGEPVGPVVTIGTLFGGVGTADNGPAPSTGGAS